MQFEVIQDSVSNHESLILPSGDSTRGLMYEESSTPGTAALASGTKNIVGHLTRDALSAGPTLADAVYPGRTELPFTGGKEASFCKPDVLEVEINSTLCVTSSTGAITTGIALGTQISASSGKFRIAQTADYAFYTVDAKLPNDAGTANSKLRLRRILDALKP